MPGRKLRVEGHRRRVQLLPVPVAWPAVLSSQHRHRLLSSVSVSSSLAQGSLCCPGTGAQKASALHSLHQHHLSIPGSVPRHRAPKPWDLAPRLPSLADTSDPAFSVSTSVALAGKARVLPRPWCSRELMKPASSSRPPTLDSSEGRWGCQGRGTGKRLRFPVEDALAV